MVLWEHSDSTLGAGTRGRLGLVAELRGLRVPWCPQDTQCQQGIGPVQVEMCSGISLCGGVSTVGKEVVGPQCCRQLLAVR